MIMILDSAPETTGEAPTEGGDAGLRELTGSQIVWEALLREGVDVCFGYPGGAIMPTYDALVNYPIRHVLTRHEQGASHMADGYARASGKVGVAIATSGPGATNLVTGLATAMLDSIPMVCITGQVPSHLLGSDAFQETDITGVTLPVTKHNYLVTRTEDLAATLREAFHIARSGRPGPVLVDITKDAQLGRCLYDPEAEPAPLPARTLAPPTSSTFAEAAKLIAQAERPLILAGQGVIFAGATDELTTLVERAHIPVANTLLGLGGFPASHALNLGMMGMHGDASVNSAVQRADLLIAIGMRFDDRVTGNLKAFAKHAKKIHIELDPAEINKNVEVDIPLVGDAKAMLKQLLAHVEAADHSTWMAEIAHFKADTAARDIAGLPDDGKLHAAHVLHDLWTLTEGEALIVSDVGQHQMWEAQYYKHDRPRSLLTSGGLGTMGFALPAAIGARFTRTHDNIWVVVGDGGFQMTACELSTCAQEGIKVNIAIINNGYLGMVRQWQEFFYERRYAATPLLSPDFVKLAESFGIQAHRVDSRKDVIPTVETARQHHGAVLIDFRVEQEDSVFPMVPAGADLHKMIRRPSPLAETGADK
jgi:acetolactate synthase-1/2/3 large subunit